MMSWQPPQNQPPRHSESSRAVAWAALFFSLVSLTLAGFVFLKSYDGGSIGEKLKDNINNLRDETARILATKKEVEDPADESTPFDSDSPDAGPKSSVRWDKLREKVSGIQAMIENGDGKAAEMLDELKHDLRAIKDYSTEKSSAAIDALVEKTEAARATLRTDAKAAGARMAEIKDDLAGVGGKTVKKAVRKVRESIPAETDAVLPEPPVEEEASGADE